MSPFGREHYVHYYPKVADRVLAVRDAVAAAPMRLVEREWVRDMPARRLRTKDGTPARWLLEPVGYLFVHNRYTRRHAFPSLYFADGVATAAAEVFGAAAVAAGRLGVPEENRLLLKVSTHIPGVLDLTDPDVLDGLSLGIDELTAVADPLDVDAFERPRAYELPQCLGEVAHEEGIGGILYPSAPDQRGTCLVVFTDHLRRHGGWYQAEDPRSGEIERWPH
jgi:RES domain-containing protein